MFLPIQNVGLMTSVIVTLEKSVPYDQQFHFYKRIIPASCLVLTYGDFQHHSALVNLKELVRNRLLLNCISFFTAYVEYLSTVLCGDTKTKQEHTKAICNHNTLISKKHCTSSWIKKRRLKYDIVFMRNR